MSHHIDGPPADGHLVIYEAPDGSMKLDLQMGQETLWLTQANLASLFGTTTQNITQHIRNIVADGELAQEATCKKILQVRQEGARQVQREVLHYNVDMAISVGYRVSSVKATQFRIWATGVLREYLVKGFVMDDARLKNPGGSAYFDELLERIRDIRASEKMFYQKVRDAFAATSTDYDKTSDTAKGFFKNIQNQLLFAVSGHTAAELVQRRADAHHPTMGLTSFPGHKVRKKDVTTAKNYLTENEMKELNRLTTMFLDYAETQAERRKPVTMSEWIAKTTDFLRFNDYPELTGAGRVSHNTMVESVTATYSAYDSARKQAEAESSSAEAAAEFTALVHRTAAMTTKQTSPDAPSASAADTTSPPQ